MVLEDVSGEALAVIIPIAGVGVVIVTILVFFWLGSGRQRSFDDAVMEAKNKADKVLRDKEHQSPRAAKKKRPFPRKKKSDAWEEGTEETRPPGVGGTSSSSSPQQPSVKSILKPVVNTATPPPERSPRNRVEFHLETVPPKVEDASSKTPRSPPTPHPSKTASFQASGSLPPISSLSEALEEEAAQRQQEPAKTAAAPPAPEEPKKKPSASSSKASGAGSSSGGGGQKKNKAKTKHVVQENLDSIEALPISRLSDIVSASSMSDEDIQVLLTVLFDKLSTNAEWEAASLRNESAKTLKKHNTELQKRYEEAQRTVLAHSSKIKDLRSEIQLEKARHVSAENNLQGKISQQVNELQISKTKISGLEQEMNQLKTAQNTQQLQEENLKLREQVATISQKSSAQTAQLGTQGQQLLELQENVVSLKRDLQRADELARKAEASAASAASATRLTELEALLKASEGEREQLQGTMQTITEEKARAMSDLDLLAATRTERDQLQAKTDEFSGQLKDAEDTLLALREELKRAQLDTTKDERAKALEGQNADLQSEMEQLQQRLKESGEQATASKQVELTALSERLTQEANSTRDKYDSDIAALKDSLAALEERNQQLQCEMDKLQATAATAGASNGPPQENGETTASVSPEEEEGAGEGAKGGAGDGEELARLKTEVEELTAEKKTLQQKLEELKTKNNDLRENCWKARDEAAEIEKACEQKLKQVYREMEQRCKAAKAEATRDATDAQKLFLQQLFPEVEVMAVGGDGVSGGFLPWLDAFEHQARQILEGLRNEVAALKAKVLELQGSEHAAIEGVEQLQSTLKETVSFLGELQSKVDDQTASHRQIVAEKDEMIERERFSNRTLQDKLLQETKMTDGLRQELKSAVAECDRRVEELEERLTTEEHHKQLAENEAETLRHSLHHELEIKENTQEKLEELNEKEEELGEKIEVEDHQLTELHQQTQKLVQEVEVLQDKLANSESQLEQVKLSNKDLNTKLSEILPSSGTSDV